MNITSIATDNVTELLFKIIEFTKARQKVLTRNINDIHTANFTPKDLDVKEFSDVLNGAISEHISNGRLLLYDTKTIKFGADGRFEVEPITDRKAERLLENNKDQYIELQINKLLENSLNQRIAAELLKQKQQADSLY